jgi:hypothetical protein
LNLGSARARSASVVKWLLFVIVTTALVPSGPWMPRARAEEPYRCPASASPRKCEKLQFAHARRERERERDLAFRAYGREHPLRLRVVVGPSLSALGLGQGYVAGMWGGGFGLGLQRELGLLAVRGDALFRLGSGEIQTFADAEEERRTGPIRGFELSPALLFRPHPFYVGPMLSTGLLVMNGKDLFAHFEYPEPHVARIRVPHIAGFGAVGVNAGFEIGPSGRIDVGAHACIGLWNGPYLYMSGGLRVAVVIAD